MRIYSSVVIVFLAAKVSADRRRHSGKSKKAPCNLADFQQWNGEVGYWLGELTLYQADGTPFESPSWPYPYDSYKGFITGECR